VVSLTGRSKAPALRDLLADDAPCIALEGFRAPMRREVDKGSFHKLSDSLVRQFPQFFAVVVPVDEIER
jgi:hypothetical protein